MLLYNFLKLYDCIIEILKKVYFTEVQTKGSKHTLLRYKSNYKCFKSI